MITQIELDEVLVNPDMGFTTQSSLDGNVPGYPASTITYYRLYRNKLEPAKGLKYATEHGVAPPYRAYKSVIEIRPLKGYRRKSILPLQEPNWSVLQWPPGRYGIYFALLDPFTNRPSVRLAVQGGDTNSWYTWSTFEIVEKGKLQKRI